MTAPLLDLPPDELAVRGPRRKFGRTVPEWVTASLFLLVPMVFLSVLLFFPLLKEVWLSFTNTRLTDPNGGSWVGAQNYRTLASSPVLLKVLVNTLTYTLGTTLLSLAGGIVSAVVVNTKFQGHSVVRAVLAAPWAVPGVAAALIWLWMFNDNGILNRILSGVGVSKISWLSSPHWAMVSVIFVTAWLFSPFVMLVTLSALQSVPAELAEASRIDGASRWSTFQYVTWPYILPTIRLIALLLTIWTLRRWDVITVLTNGGPVNATSTIVVATQQQAFTYQQVGQGAAYAMIGIVIAGVLATGYYLLERSQNRIEGTR
jgi:multiple sugar transport system permease protein